jgi:hypothetical protein
VPPAQLTNKSIFSFFIIFSKLFINFIFVISKCTGIILTSAYSSINSVLLAQAKTLYPRSARPLVISFPIPKLAPVTTAVLITFP